MIRHGPWKLNYYHGHPPQLFNLADDPDELRDLAAEPAHAATRRDLTARVLADWRPDDVARRMAGRREEVALLKAWARRVCPADQYRWELRPEMNYLDEEPSGATPAAPG